MSRKSIKGVLAAVLAAGLILCAGCAKKAPADAPASGAGSAGTPAAAAAAPNPAAEKAHVDAYGIVKAKTVHNINLDFPATLKKKLVSEGQRVRRGEVLFSFSNEDYQAQIKNKLFELTSAQLELKKAALAVEKLQDDLEIAQADADKADKDLKGKEKMFSMGAASQNDVDDYRKALSTRQQEVKALQRSLEESSGGEVNGLDTQKTRIANLEVELERLKDQSNRGFISDNAIVCDVRDGVVYEIGYAEGDFISREKKLCSLMDLDSLIVEANIPEEFIKDVKVGSAADIIPVADNTKLCRGTVTRISNLAVKNNGETVVPVEIALDKKDGFLLPYFNVDVKIYAATGAAPAPAGAKAAP